MVKQVHQLSLDQVEVIQLKNAWSLEDQNLDESGQGSELIVFFEVVDEFEKNFCEEEPVGVGLGLSDEEALISQGSL